MKTFTVAAAVAATILLGQQRPLSSIVSDLKKLVGELEQLQSRTIVVAPGAAVQPALDQAQPGDVVVLQAGAKYLGALTLAAKSGIVTIRSSATLPLRRITPADAALLPLIASGNNGPAIAGVAGANWRLEGIALESNATGVGEVVLLEGAQNVTLDRVLLVAGVGGQKRGIRGNGRGITLTRSWIANIIRAGQDSQAFAAWEGAGPYTLTDNYLEASGENVLFGGSDNLGGFSTNPCDITITDNTLFKPQAWRNQPGTVKNLLELKNACRVVVRDNRLEGNWTDGQAGWSVVLTPVNQDGRAPWTTVNQVLIERNYLTAVERGFNLTGRAYLHVSQQSSGIVIRKNVVETSGQCFQMAAELADVTIEDNVCDNGSNIATLYVGGVLDTEGMPYRDARFAVGTLVFNRNAARHNNYGVFGGTMGTSALTANTQRWTFLENRIVGLKGTYPASTVTIDEATLSAAKAALLKELGR